jgi:cytochrome c biogenesis protein CcmG/thiol:disulfide interchange protein DsbE
MTARISTLLLAALLLGCSTAPKEEASVSEPLQTSIKPLTERQAAPQFELKDANGAKFTLADYKDKVVLLNFWATWCVPCKAEIPWFQEFEQKFKDQGLAVVGVSMDEEGWEAVKPYIAEHKIGYRMVVGNEQVSTLYGGIDSLPQTFMIDREGKIAAIHTGLVSKATYQKEIEDLLEKKNVAVLDDAGGKFPAAGGSFRAN